MLDNGHKRMSGIAHKDSGQSLIPDIEPFVEHHGLEQRSREVREDETRIRFAREKHRRTSAKAASSAVPGARRREISRRIMPEGETCSKFKERN